MQTADAPIPQEWINQPRRFDIAIQWLGGKSHALFRRYGYSGDNMLESWCGQGGNTGLPWTDWQTIEEGGAITCKRCLRSIAAYRKRQEEWEERRSR